MYERGNPGAAALVKRSEVNLQESVLSSTQCPGIELRSPKHAQKELYLQSHLAIIIYFLEKDNSGSWRDSSAARSSNEWSCGESELSSQDPHQFLPAATPGCSQLAITPAPVIQDFCQHQHP